MGYVMDYECIKVEEKYEGAVTEITIGPAPANFLSEQVMYEISKQLREDEKNTHKKLILFRGEGDNFGCGASVEEHKPEKVNEMLPSFHNFISDLLHYKIPSIARVKGLCLGGSFEFALACTFIYADEDSKFAIPEIQLGVFPPVASVLLPAKGCDQLSSHMILTGEQICAEELERQGVVHAVVETENVEQLIEEFITKHLLPKSASSLRLAHTACRAVVAQQYKNFINRIEDLYLGELMSTKDGVEGTMAFLEKRKPVWQDA